MPYIEAMVIKGNKTAEKNGKYADNPVNVLRYLRYNQRL